MNIDVNKLLIDLGECFQLDNEFVVGLREGFEYSDMEFSQLLFDVVFSEGFDSDLELLVSIDQRLEE